MKHLVATLLLLAGAAQAQGLDVAGERARIAAERRQADARYTQEERACRSRFAVNDCTAEARARHREALGALRRQEIALNDMERRRKAAEKLRELEERQAQEAAGQQAKQPGEPVRESKAREARQADKAARREPKAARAPIAPKRSASAAAAPKEPAITPAEAEANRRAHEARVKEAEEHRAKVTKRQAERKKPPAAPLPPPPR